MRELLRRYKHAWCLLYMVIYFVWFFALEKAVTTNYTPVYTKIDDFIPFNEYFIIPYYLWFIFIAGTVVYFFFTSKSDYYRCCAFLFIGMTICLTIYTIWPNGQNLRPNLDTLGRYNIFIHLIRNLYMTDTNTNVCPSIHVFNSLGALIAIRHSERLKSYTWIQYGSFILTILICLSTMFLKQHSFVDTLSAMLLAIVMYIVVYIPDYSRLIQKRNEKKLLAINKE